MGLSPEQLRERWNSLIDKAPAVFDPTEANWADLPVAGIKPHLDPLLEKEGFRTITAAELPSLNSQSPRDMRKVWEVERVEDLPEYVQRSSVPVRLDEVMKTWMSPAIYFAGMDAFHDPEDVLFYTKPAKTDHEATYIGLRHVRDLMSIGWEVQWKLQMDTFVGIQDDISLQMAETLVPPQSARSDIRALDGRVGAVHRARYTDFHRYSPLFIDGVLGYSHYVGFNREGDYPVSDELKPQVFAALASVIRDVAVYELNYRDQLMDVYRLALAKGVNLPNLFAASQV